MVAAESSSSVASLSELPLDSNNHLSSHWVLFSNSESCYHEKEVVNEWENSLGDLLFSADIVGSLSKKFFGTGSNYCQAVCLEIGTPMDYLDKPIETRIFRGEDSAFEHWWENTCMDTEVGFVSYINNPVNLLWVTERGEKVEVGVIEYGEQKTFWIGSKVGHTFVLEDSVTFDEIGVYTIKSNSFFPFGDALSYVQDSFEVESGIWSTFVSEYHRSRRIKRSFTELGFNKGRLPDDLWGSIQTYYYNNRNNKVREEYEFKGYTVNWWEVDPFFIGMPWGLKGYWQTRLRALVEKWIGGNITLENTDIYGMRRYEDGARLLTHVDREATHATSLIINVAQEAIREPWYVEIYDHADRLHEIEMNPGDIVYYESAKALHGRMKPLQGAYYVNLFAHYRPAGDPEWYLKPNPEGTPAPAIDLGEACDDAEGGTEECKTHPGLRTLSPSGHVVRGPTDLFEYWKSVSPKKSGNQREEL